MMIMMMMMINNINVQNINNWKKRFGLSVQTMDVSCIEFCVWQRVSPFFFYMQNDMKYKRPFPLSLALHRLKKLRRRCVSFSARLSEWRAHWSLTDGRTSALGFVAVPGWSTLDCISRWASMKVGVKLSFVCMNMSVYAENISSTGHL